MQCRSPDKGRAGIVYCIALKYTKGSLLAVLSFLPYKLSNHILLYPLKQNRDKI